MRVAGHTLLAGAAAVALAASRPSVTRAQQKRKAEMANPEGQPASAVQQYIDAFNKGDAKRYGSDVCQSYVHT